MSHPIKVHTSEDSPPEAVHAGVLTTDHAASSYGLPVVLIDDTPHSAAELGGATIEVLPDEPMTSSNIAAVCRRREAAEQAAVRAGYSLAYAGTQ